MSYIVCKKCGKYYELQEGESPDDFAGKCECGGSLDYVQDFNMHVMDELYPLDGFVICPECGKKNVKTSKLCEFCEKPLIEINIDKSKKGLYIALGIVIIVLILVFTLFLV